MPDARRGAFAAGLIARLLLACALCLLGGFAQAAPRVGVATMLPGSIFFERFGHDAIVVQDPATGDATSYNFGFFDPGEDDFIARFVRGEMRYRLGAPPSEDDMQDYREGGGGVGIRGLDLEPAEAHALADALAVNARPENARYGYDYFRDNCATRVRDAIDRALHGGLHRQLESRSHGRSYRSEAVRLASPAMWMWLGFDVGLGPSADAPLSLWDEAFVPMRLADALRESVGSQGRPLVLREETVLPHRIAPEPAEVPRPWWPWALAGLAIALALTALARRAPRTGAGMALRFWLLCGGLAALMLFLWLATAHRFAWANQNLFLFSPLCLLLLGGAWARLRGRAPGRVFAVAGGLLLAGGVVALFAHWLPVEPQRNAHWIALILPVQAALVLALRRR